ncbi:MAG: DsbA family protein [Clostridiales bacterium]|jgi:predicted DsbA family dithiol-disulfide isomerase|nr:DsbA family protein [Clostridiales bacterium]
MEVFFDYSCPFCKRTHADLVRLIKSHPETEIEWRPCEAHPRPERGPHSDKCIQGMYYALEHGVDIWAYHDLMYNACLKGRIDYESIDALANFAKSILDAEDFKAALESGKYEKIQLDGNDYAFEQSGVWAVPAFRKNGLKLDAIEGVGVSGKHLEDFLSKA